MEIHRGKILYNVARRHGKTIAKIAKEAGFDPSSFYVHIRKPDLSLTILYKYSKVLDHDFSKELPEMEEYLSVNGLNHEAAKTLSYAELLKERDHWRNKYYDQLEQNNKLIKEKYNQE